MDKVVRAVVAKGVTHVIWVTLREEQNQWSAAIRAEAATKRRRFFTFTVEADGKQLPVGRPVPRSFFQQASFNVPGLTSGFQIGTMIVFTRIGTSKSDSWHGSIRLPRSTLSGKTYSLTGTFAAPWCGTTRG